MYEAMDLDGLCPVLTVIPGQVLGPNLYTTEDAPLYTSGLLSK